MTLHQELTSIMEVIKSTGAVGGQSPDVYMDYIMQLTAHMARSGEIMAVAKDKLHKARKQAYLNTWASLTGNSADGAVKKKKAAAISPLLVKDYINDCCPEENALYELAERTNKACTHTIDALRTVLSTLKTEMLTAQHAA